MRSQHRLAIRSSTWVIVLVAILRSASVLALRLPAVLSHDQFHVNPGSLFPGLYRLEQDGKVNAEWRPTENNRRAKYYRPTASGQRQLEQHRERWIGVSFAVTSVLEGA
jgi:hypothetical protein